MAAKKAKKVAAKKPAAKKAASVKAPSARIAEKLLSQLPPLDERRRRVYRNAFSEEQCIAWGSRTRAAAVFAEAERIAGSAFVSLKKSAVTGYSLHRLAWLAHLITELSDAIARDAEASPAPGRVERSGAVTIADKARKKLVNGLLSVATGNAAFIKAVTDRNESNQSAHSLESTLTGLLQLAVTARRSPDGELLCDDAGLSEEFLSSISAITESLREANEATYGERTGTDSQRTNLIEGRVLRELGFLAQAFKNAREAGEAIGTLPPSRLVAQAANTSPRKADAIPDPAATPTS